MLRRMVGESIDRRRLPSEISEEYIRNYSDRKLAELRNGVYVNCWYSGPHESAAIWQWASRTGMAVAIESSFVSLISSVRSPEPFRAGTVTYHDYDTESVPERSRLRVFFCKRASFEHEHEVRLLIDRTKPKMERPSKGLLLPVDLENLIRRVIVAPLAEDYILDVVRALVASFGPAVEVVRSRLDDDPVY